MHESTEEQLRQLETQDFDAQMKAVYQDLSRAIEIKPKMVQGYFGRAVINRKLKNFSPSIRDPDVALELNADNASAFLE